MMKTQGEKVGSYRHEEIEEEDVDDDEDASKDDVGLYRHEIEEDIHDDEDKM